MTDTGNGAVGDGSTGQTCVVYGASELVVGPAGWEPADQNGGHTGVSHGDLEVIEDGALVAVDGRVEVVGETATITRGYPPENADVALDATGKAVVPGFVDPHTHAVFAGDRSDEFEANLEGASYQELLAEGGGILRTVRATREPSLETLVEALCAHLDVMLAHGTTTVEVKSGYGLDVETECRMLEAIDVADERHPVDLVATFLGAHAVPEGATADAYVDRVVEHQLPAVADQGIATYCDVFCEADVFSVGQSRRVLEAGLEYGLTPKVHAEELSHLGGAKLAAEVGAASADHLLYATDEDVQAMIEADVVPVLLPGTAFGLGEAYADARGMFEAGAPVALATDFNPNCHSRDMGFVQTLACLEMGLTPAEALLGSTVNAAAAIGRTDGTGTLSPGGPADLLVLEGPRYAQVAYRFDTTAVEQVLVNGTPVSTSVIANDGGETS